MITFCKALILNETFRSVPCFFVLIYVCYHGQHNIIKFHLFLRLIRITLPAYFQEKRGQQTRQLLSYRLIWINRLPIQFIGAGKHQKAQQAPKMIFSRLLLFVWYTALTQTVFGKFLIYNTFIE